MLLPNYSKQLSFKDLNIDLSEKIIGNKIKHNTCSDYLLNDINLERYLSIENIKFESLFKKSQKLLKILNFDGGCISEIVPQKFTSESKKDLHFVLSTSKSCSIASIDASLLLFLYST